MSGRFFDSNVILYLLSGDLAKAERSEALIRAGGIVSVQVLNEVTQVCRRKYKLDWPVVDALLAGVRAACTVVPVTLEVHDRARRLCQRYQLGWYDSLILAAAQGAGCTTLWSEDLQNGMTMDGLTISNPYT